MNLDHSSLDRAIGSLARGIDRASHALDDEELRDAVIQRFEYTFELCWKMIKRRVEADAPTPSEVDFLSYKDLMREAGERGLVKEVVRWFVYRDQRNLTSHTYNADKAREVYHTAVEFLPDARALLAELESRNHE